MFNWDELPFFTSGEWQVIQERLDDLDHAKTLYCPARFNLFASLDATPFDQLRVVFMGQDPYPDARLATGLAFSIPKAEKRFPASLQNLFKEYCSDLGLSVPTSGDLTPWAKQGVLLWNALPTCIAGQPLSHEGWVEWQLLTQQIVEKASERQVVFAFLGGRARDYVKYVSEGNEVIVTSHPSPRGILNSKTPLLGSRLFSTINDKLRKQGLDPVEWRLQ